MKNIIFIVGPTCSGKSSLAVNLAKDLNCEVINADAFQVYKGVSIGNNKITEAKKMGVEHHLLDLITTNDPWNIKEFQTAFFKLVINSDKNFIVAGGSNLYVDCVIKNYNLENEIKPFEFDLSSEEKWDLLHKLDKESADKVDKNNIRRVEHKLKIIMSNKEKASVVKNNTQIINPFIVKIHIDRKNLYEKINARADLMIKNGWIEEVKQILKNSKPNSQIFQALGYSEIRDHILNGNKLDIDEIKKKTRHYAKRQETWCRNKFKIDYLYKDNNYNNLLIVSKEFLKNGGK